jgi:biotin operon repressor
LARAQRLLELIQVLRRHRRPVSGETLAEELGVSLRTVYRDIQTLIGQGASIDGEAGVGYVLRPGFVLPPLMFSDEEIEALVLGSRWVAQRTDEPLARAAQNAIAKIAAVLPEDLRDSIEGNGLLAGPPSRAGRSAPSASWFCNMPMPRAGAANARSGRSRSASSIASGCWRPGASYARTIGISAPTASSRCRSPTSAIRAAAAR